MRSLMIMFTASAAAFILVVGTNNACADAASKDAHTGTAIGSQTGGAGGGKVRRPDTPKRGIIIDDSKSPKSRKGSNE